MGRLFVTIALLHAAAGAASLPFSRFGVMDTPSAFVLTHTQIELGGCFTSYGYEKADSSSESDFALGGYIEFGLFDRAQAGITYLGAGGLSGQIRAVVLKESLNRPGLALGAENLTGEQDYEFYEDDSLGLYHYPENQNFSVYLVVSKNLDYILKAPIAASIGYGLGRFRQDPDTPSDGIENPLPGLFGSVEFHPDPRVGIVLEWDGRDANFGGWYEISDMVRVSAAVAEFEQLARGDERVETDVMQNAKFTLGVQATLGPFFNRTTLEPAERLRQQGDLEALRQLEEERRRALERIEELLRSMD